ncbi:MAG: pyridoxine 5'-phosphate oxidase C-terminal domain-containing protein [Dysgonomonas sp.]
MNFGKAGENRLHDRIRYRSENGKWIIERLAP